MAYAYIEKAYGLTFRVGERVLHAVTKKIGTVKREDPGMGHYVMVAFDGQRFALPCHPNELIKDFDAALARAEASS